MKNIRTLTAAFSVRREGNRELGKGSSISLTEKGTTPLAEQIFYSPATAIKEGEGRHRVNLCDQLVLLALPFR